MSQLVFEVPDEQTPGYLRRLMTATKFHEELDKVLPTGERMLTGERYEKLIDFLLGFVTEPEDRGEAREALLDATQEQYLELLQAANGRVNPTPPKPSETS